MCGSNGKRLRKRTLRYAGCTTHPYEEVRYVGGWVRSTKKGSANSKPSATEESGKYHHCSTKEVSKVSSTKALSQGAGACIVEYRESLPKYATE